MSRTQSVPAMGSTRFLPLLFPAGCLCFAILLGVSDAFYAPDAGWYRMLALGQRAAVPAPFSARLLAPAAAGWLGRATGLGADRGFLILAVVCLLALLAMLSRLLWSWQAPAVIFAGIFLMPFWADLFHDYYLPDLLHATILAAILLCLLYGHTTLALLLLFPAYLARESTILVGICLIFAGWRRIPLRTAAIGLVAMVSAGVVSRHYGLGGPASVHGLGGGVYLLGKLIWSLFKNLIGLPLWSNTLPECQPMWVRAVPAWLPLGAIRTIGMCPPDPWGPSRIFLAWFGLFGIGPACALALRKNMFSHRGLGGSLWGKAGHAMTPPWSSGQIIVLRFAIVYGAISILMTPLLGASADRLVAYGWPFYFVALAWFLARSFPGLSTRVRGYAAGLLLLHLTTCWVAYFAFRQQTANDVLPAVVVVCLNGIGYLLLRRIVRPA